MPIKDVDENRKYQSEWARRKKAGKNTKIKNRRVGRDPAKLRKNVRASHKKERERRKRVRKEKLGTKCKICGRTKGKLSSHEKYNNPHTLFDALKKEDFEKIVWEDYILLCHQCHQMAHFVFKYLGMTWLELKERRKEFLSSSSQFN